MQWIKCSERLPAVYDENCDGNIIFKRSDLVNVAGLNKKTGKYIVKSGFLHNIGRKKLEWIMVCERNENVTHWM